ncbi:MAG: 50S ribosomal protein L23 [Gemmatimonadales bacterium]|jgi:large subunit ribosomal protein L23
MSRAPQEVLIRPLITEQSSILQAEQNKYTFEVHRDATKIDIRNAVEEMFDVSVKSVRTMNCLGKERRVGRSTGRRRDWKKAIVTLHEGEMIDMYGGV